LHLARDPTTSVTAVTNRIAVLTGAPPAATFRLYATGTGPGVGPCLSYTADQGLVASSHGP
jgi:hypothetical protein